MRFSEIFVSTLAFFAMSVWADNDNDNDDNDNNDNNDNDNDRVTREAARFSSAASAYVSSERRIESSLIGDITSELATATGSAARSSLSAQLTSAEAVVSSIESRISRVYESYNSRVTAAVHDATDNYAAPTQAPLAAGIIGAGIALLAL